MDFETANGKRHSACSLALVVVRENKIVNSFYTLIKPDTEFSPRNIQIHGIRPRDVADAPMFPEVWTHIKDLFTPNHLVTAHNANFDVGVLKNTLEHYQIQTPHYMVLDTLRTSRKFYPNFPNHKLNTVCAELNIDLEHHHNALADSIACANILLTQDQQYGDQALKKLVKLT